MKKISWDETMEYLEILSQISLTEEEKQETAGELKKNPCLYGKAGRAGYGRGGTHVPCLSGTECIS